MANTLFKLNTQITEDKVIERFERIYSDALYLGLTGNLYPLNTTSKAPRQKIKFFLDAITYVVEGTKFVYRIGEYVELENLEKAQFITERGFFWLTYECSENDGSGAYNWKITSNNPAWSECYISQVVFQDSYCNSALGWLNPDNPQNILSVIQTQKLPGVRRMDLTYFKATPWFTVNKWNENFTLYEDDFIRIDCFSNAATNRLVAILPKGNAKLKEHEAPFTTAANNPKHYHTTGMMQEKPTATALFCRPVLLADEWTKALTDLIVPGVPLDGDATGSEIIKDVCFTFNCNTNVLRQFRMLWDAIDGYTYGMDIEFFSNTVGASSGVWNFNIEAVYLGRQETGANPVPEAGV